MVALADQRAQPAVLLRQAAQLLDHGDLADRLRQPRIGGVRMSPGTVCAASASRLSAPTARSMAAMSASAGATWRAAKLSSSAASSATRVHHAALRQQRVIAGLVHQRLERGGVGQLELEEPALAGRVTVHQRRVVGQPAVDLGHAAGERGVDVAGRLHRLDDGDGLLRRDLAAGLGQLDEHQVPQRVLRVGGDADGGDGAVQADPLVVLGVADHGAGSFSGRSGGGRRAGGRRGPAVACRAPAGSAAGRPPRGPGGRSPSRPGRRRSGRTRPR